MNAQSLIDDDDDYERVSMGIDGKMKFYKREQDEDAESEIDLNSDEDDNKKLFKYATSKKADQDISNLTTKYKNKSFNFKNR